MDKSSFRVFPMPHNSPSKKRFRESLHEEVHNYDNSKKQPLEKIGRHVAEHEIHKKQALSKSVFGYDINPDSFKK